MNKTHLNWLIELSQKELDKEDKLFVENAIVFETPLTRAEISRLIKIYERYIGYGIER